LEFLKSNIPCVPALSGVQGVTGKRPEESAAGWPLLRRESKLAG